MFLFWTVAPYSVSIEDAYTTYRNMVYRLALVNTSGKEDAEDVFQEVFVKLVKHQNKIQSEEHLKAWLIRVTVNQCRTHFVVSHADRNTPLESIGELQDEQMSNQFSELERGEVLFQGVQSLKEPYRTIIHLFYMEEYSLKEIANILKSREGQVKTQLFRARQKLKQYMDERGISYEDL